MDKKAKTNRPGKLIGGFFMNLVLWIFSLSCIFPLVWMLYSSFKEKRAFNADIIGLPKSPTLINYIRILTNKDYHLGESMWNSVRTTVLSIVLIVLFSYVVGYILARVRFKLNRVLYAMFLMGMLIPVHSLLVPIYVVFRNCGLSNRWFTLLLPYISFGLPMGIFLVEGYVKGIPVSLEEAAAIDGAGAVTQFFKITIPMLTPTVFFVMITSIISGFQVFDTVYMMVGKANPAYESTQTVVMLFYRQAFDYGHKGYAAAISILIFLAIMLVTVIQMIGQKKWVNYDYE